MRHPSGGMMFVWALLAGCTGPAAHRLSDLDANLSALRRKYEDVEGDLMMLTPRIVALERANRTANTNLRHFKREIVAPFMAEERRELVRLDRAIAAIAGNRRHSAGDPEARDSGEPRQTETKQGADVPVFRIPVVWKGASEAAKAEPTSANMIQPGPTVASPDTPSRSDDAPAPASSREQATGPEGRQQESDAPKTATAAAAGSACSGKKAPSQESPPPVGGNEKTGGGAFPKEAASVLDAYRDVIARYPGSDQAAEAWLAIGLIGSRIGRLDEAERAFQSASRSRGSSPLRDRALLELGRIDLRRGRPARARAVFSGILESDPKSAFAREASVEIPGTYEAEGDHEKAIGEYARLEKTAADAGIATKALARRAGLLWSTGRTEEAAAAYRELLGRGADPAAKSTSLLRLGEAALRRGKPVEARELLVRIGSDYPGSEAAKAAAFLIGRTHLSEESSLKGARALLAAVKQYPHSERAPRALLDAGDALVASELPLEAVGTYRKALALAASCKDMTQFEGVASRAQLSIAGALERSARYEGAEGEYRQFLAQFPRSPLSAKARLGLGRTYLKLGRWDEARSKLRAAARGAQGSEAFQALVALAELEERQNRPVEALKAIQAALAARRKEAGGHDEDYLRAAYRHAGLLDALGRTEEALAGYERLAHSAVAAPAAKAGSSLATRAASGSAGAAARRGVAGAGAAGGSGIPLLAMFRAGRCLERLGRDEAAESAYERFLDRVSKNGTSVSRDDVRQARWNLEQIRFLRRALATGAVSASKPEGDR